jgi:hypothetical protein
MAECDYNFHKSNSTYFSDMDVSRAHLVTALQKKGIAHYNDRQKNGEVKESLLIALGAVACVFKREIPPYEPYEIWSRVLTWDHKWLYIVSYFVKKDVFDPKHYTTMNHTGVFGTGWFAAKKRKSGVEPDLSKVRYAVGLSKYVYKSGRKTIPPEAVLVSCKLLPERTPAVSPTSDGLSESTVDVGSASVMQDLKEQNQKLSEQDLDRLLADSIVPGQADDNAPWTWERCEAERLKGLELAQGLGALDGLVNTFQSERAFGRFWSLC